MCTFDAVFRYAFRASSTLTLDGRPVPARMTEEPFRSIVASNKLGTVRPQAPMLDTAAVADPCEDRSR